MYNFPHCSHRAIICDFLFRCYTSSSFPHFSLSSFLTYPKQIHVCQCSDHGRASGDKITYRYPSSFSAYGNKAVNWHQYHARNPRSINSSAKTTQKNQNMELNSFKIHLCPCLLNFVFQLNFVYTPETIFITSENHVEDSLIVIFFLVSCFFRWTWMCNL